MKVDAKTDVKIEGDNVIVSITETQTKTKQEHEKDVQYKKSLLGQYQSKLAELKSELVDVMDVEEDEETKKVAEMLEKAEKVKQKKAVSMQISHIEEQLVQIEKNLKEIQL